MKRFSSLLLIACSSLFLLNSCNNEETRKKSRSKKSSNKITLGMRVESDNKLAGIPIASTPLGGQELPEDVDLSDKLPEIGDQGNQQSCVAWAVAYALKSYQERVDLGEQINFSPSYIYNQINHGENVPTYITDALNVLSSQGVCTYEEMPYDEKDWKTKPGTNAKMSAKRFRIDYWRQVNIQDIKEVKAQLAAGLPVVIGADVSTEFINEGATNGASYIWKDKGTSAGGHAMLVVGYDNEKNAFKVMNSWGKSWGDNGFAWIDYDLFPQVIMYGFVAKDALTSPDTVANLDDKNKNANDKPYDEKEKRDEHDYYNDEDYFEDEELNPRDNPTAFDTINFHSSEVVHNVKIPNEETLGKAMKISGTVDIPARFGKKFQIAIHIYNAQTGQQVKSMIYPDYADVNGFAAKATPEYDITEAGFRNGTWWVNIPYRAINLPPGTTYYYAVPTLFVDNFGVAFGDKIDFWVRK